MRTPSAIVSAAVLSGALWSAAAPAADAPYARLTGIDAAPTESAVVQATAVSSQSEYGHCSLVGAVQHPGTYRSVGGTVLLETLLEQAGGLAGNSSGIVRILHGGRQQMVNLSLSSGSEVVPQGSVIVADTGDAAPAGERAFVDIACVQLCDRPVVLCLKPSDATLPRLLNLLGQPSELTAAVRVVVPSGHPSAADLALPSGTVVLFDPTTINQLALADVLSRAPLSDVVDFEPVQHQQVAAETVAQLESLEQFLAVGNATPATDASPVAETTSRPLTAPLPTTSAIPPSLAVTLAAPEPVLETESETPQVRPVSALQLQSVAGPAGRPDEQFTAEDYLRAKQRAKAAQAAHDSPETADEVVAPAAGSIQSRWLDLGTSIAAWLLCAFAAYGAFGIWMRQHGRRRESLRTELAIELPKPAPIIESRTALSHLIENSLPLREEDAPAPSQTFHGRTVGFRYLTRSGPHPLQGPHFAAARVQAPAETATAQTARPQPAAQVASSDRIERTIKRFDRAVEAQRETRAARPNVKAKATVEHVTHSVSPLERALRNLMRESSEGRT